jgi:hypothetical protein
VLLANGSFGTRHAARLADAVARAQQERARNIHASMRRANRFTDRTRLVARLALALSRLEYDGTSVALFGRFTRDMAKAKFLALDTRLAARLAFTGASLDKRWTLGHRGDLLPQGVEFIKLLSLEKLGIDGVDELDNHLVGNSGHCSLGWLLAWFL